MAITEEQNTTLIERLAAGENRRDILDDMGISRRDFNEWQRGQNIAIPDAETLLGRLRSGERLKVILEDMGISREAFNNWRRDHKEEIAAARHTGRTRLTPKDEKLIQLNKVKATVEQRVADLQANNPWNTRRIEKFQRHLARYETLIAEAEAE